MNDIIFSIAMIFYSVYLFLESLKLPEGIANMPGPGFFPRLIAFVILILSCFILGAGIWKFFRKKEKALATGKWVQSLSVIGCTFLYVLIWGRGNFIFNTILLLFLIQMITGSKWYIALIGSIVLSVSTYLLFGKVFHVLFF